MIKTLFCLVALVKVGFKQRHKLPLENLALRQQLAVFHRTQKRLQLRRTDRLFWVWLSRMWESWRESLIIVKPDTVVRSHRKGFALYWTRLSSRNHFCHPGTGREIKELIWKMADSNPLWGSPRLHGELLKLGIDISERTVARLMPKRKKPPSQTWRAFLDNHLRDLVSIDFLVAPTATFRVLFVLIVLAYHRRRVVHFNVTEHPTHFVMLRLGDSIGPGSGLTSRFNGRSEIVVCDVAGVDAPSSGFSSVGGKPRVACVTALVAAISDAVMQFSDEVARDDTRQWAADERIRPWIRFVPSGSVPELDSTE
jgi:hypothetical protein